MRPLGTLRTPFPLWVIPRRMQGIPFYGRLRNAGPRVGFQTTAPSLSRCPLAFAPFDGVLLDDARDPIPGAVAVTLHFQVERALAKRDRRSSLKPSALRDRAAACQALLGQGLLPEQLKALGRYGLVLGDPGDTRSLASLVRHLEAYLEAVHAQSWLEPAEALWRAAEARVSGRRGFWVERQEEDGPLEAGLQELAPPMLRSLCLLPELGRIRFRLATRRGAGQCGLFAGQEPHLVRLLLPTLEALAAERGLEHLELETPAHWGENPWGAALDRLFEGPLEGPQDALQRATLPTEATVWRAAVEQVCAWVEAGLEPADITLVHPDPAGLGPLLASWLAAEGIPLRGLPGRTLKESAPWAALWALVSGLRDLDPAALAAGLASSALTPLARSLRSLAMRLDRVDQTGEAALHEAFAALGAGDRHWVKDRWDLLWSLRTKTQGGTAWLGDLEALALRLERVEEPGAFYPALNLLAEAWSGDPEPLALGAFLEVLEGALTALRAPDPLIVPGGVRLVSPAALETAWEGSRATLLLDLGEGAWPPTPSANPELDWPRLAQLNRALRAQAAAGAGAPDFPPHLQTFLLPEAEENEVLPRAFHREAYRFNRVLALTREHLVALTAERDSEGQLRAQGPFWRALEGAEDWRFPIGRAASGFRWRWEAPEPAALTRARQASLGGAAAPLADRTSELWLSGRSAETPIAPTLLEGLARCPFRVLAEKHLKLRAWVEGDGHALHLGTLAHRLMEGILSGLIGAEHWPAAFLERVGGASTAALQGQLQGAWDAAGPTWLAELGLSASESARLRLGVEELLPAMAEVLGEDLVETAPSKDEAAYVGLSEGGTWRRELLGLEWKLAPRTLELPLGQRLWVQGTLDRVERWTRGSEQFLRIVDYKTSRYGRLKDYRAGALGAHLQLPLYQALLEEELGLPTTALLISLRETGKPVPMMCQGEDRAALLANLEALVDRARLGDFPATPGEHCSTCGLSALCGRPVDIDTVEGEE